MGAKDDEGLRSLGRSYARGGNKEQLTALRMIHDAGACCSGIRSRIAMEETKATLHLTLCDEEGSYS